MQKKKILMYFTDGKVVGGLLWLSIVAQQCELWLLECTFTRENAASRVSLSVTKE